MSAYPIVYDQSPPTKRSRLTVFFRTLLAIPHFFWAVFYGIAAYAVVFIVWFAILFTGKFPAGMYEFVAGFLRYYTRLTAYSNLVVDTYPPFDGGEHPEYPVRLKIGPPQATYSRLKTFFRTILAIPINILIFALSIWVFFISVAIWFVAVIMGKTDPGLPEAMRFPMSYIARGTGYGLLLTDKYPPVSETEPLPHLSQPVG